MFRLIESSSGKFFKHVLGTPSKNAHFWGPKNAHFHWMYLKHGSKIGLMMTL